MLKFSGLLALGAMLGACTTSEVKLAHSVPLVGAEQAYAERELLDIGVVVFESGVPEGEIDRDLMEELLRDGLYVQIRRAEAMYMAVKLRETLEKSGHWGSVWVTPRESNAVDLLIHGEIRQSDGNILDLHVRAEDARGRVWLDDSYRMETAASSYNRQRYPDLDPYQDVFNEIANDLAEIRGNLGDDDVAEIRTLSELRYASELSPEAFGEYVDENGNGVFEPVRLPAVNDPTFARTRAVRQQEQNLIETLDQYYEGFMLDATNSYDGWREFSREDSIRLQQAARSAKTRTALGALSIAMAIAYGQNSDSNNLADRLITQSGIYIGGDLLRAASSRRQERRLHTQSLQELSESFDDDVKPLVVEVQGNQHRLTGTADAQYGEWQDLIRDLWISETGFEPENMDLYVEPDIEPSSESAAPESASAPGAAPESQEATDADGGAAAQA